MEPAVHTPAQGWVRLIDCLYAAGEFERAASTLAEAVVACPSFRTAPEFRAINQALSKARA